MSYLGGKEVMGQCSDCGGRGKQKVLGRHRDLVCEHCLGLRERFARSGQRPSEPNELFAGPLRSENYGNSRDWRCYRIACLELGYTLRLVRDKQEYTDLMDRWSDYLRWGALALGVNRGYNAEDAAAWDLAKATLASCDETKLAYIVEAA